MSKDDQLATDEPRAAATSQSLVRRALTALEHRPGRVVAVMVLAYFILEVVYAMRLPLVMDEFQGAATVLDLRHLVPYRDFSPYKTVLGYYLQLPELALVHDLWLRLVGARVMLAALTAIGIAFTASRLRRQFHVRAVLLSVPVLLATSDFLERSAEIRVDMLTSLVGLFALLALLEERPALAGGLATLSCFVSQKGAIFVVAVAVALATRWLFLDRDRNAFSACLRACVAGLAVTVAYVGAWSAVASPVEILRATFITPLAVASGDQYSLFHHWAKALWRNPAIHAIAGLALGGLFASRGATPRARRDWQLLGWGATVVVLCLISPQPWPYFFVFLHPTLWVLVVSFLDREIARSGRLTRPVVVALVLLGIAWPLTRVPHVLKQSSTHQEYVIRLAASLVPPEAGYLAGLRLLPERRHVLPETLGWLDKAQLLWLDDQDPRDILAGLQADPPSIVIWNYRCRRLPEPVKLWIVDNYAVLSAEVLVPAPAIAADSTVVRVSRAGRYRVAGPEDTVLGLDGKRFSPGDFVVLTVGDHQVDMTEAPEGARVVFAPEGIEERIDPAEDQPAGLFVRVYS